MNYQTVSLDRLVADSPFCCRFGSPLSPLERKQRAKDARDKERHAEKDKAKEADKATSKLKLPASPSPAASTSAPILDPAPPLPPPSARPLAGVAEQAQKITGHIAGGLRARRVFGAGARSMPVPGVVLTGLQGAGKTALVHELARGLEVDKSTLTRKLDCREPVLDRADAVRWTWQTLCTGTATWWRTSHGRS